MADGRFDDLLLAVAQRHKNSAEMLDSLLSFFERRTDLFHIMETPTDRMGFRPRVAEDMVAKQFRFFQHRYMDRAQPHLLRRALGVEGEAAEAAPSSSSAAPAAPVPVAPPPPQPPLASAEDTAGGGGGPALPESTRRMMKHISTWNGAVTDRYHWSQSIREVTLEIEVEPCRAKELKVDITATRLSIKLRGQTVLEGKLHEKVTVDETVWHLDNGNQIVLSLEKHRESWWKCVFEGDQEIDTTKVESTRTMDEYDGETQGAIRKIMFDQNQKVQGKASSDQIRTADIMKDAWNAPGSPFRGSDFDPTLLNLSSAVPDDFFAEVEKRRLEEALQQKAQGASGAPAS